MMDQGTTDAIMQFDSNCACLGGRHIRGGPQLWEQGICSSIHTDSCIDALGDSVYQSIQSCGSERMQTGARYTDDQV